MRVYNKHGEHLHFEMYSAGPLGRIHFWGREYGKSFDYHTPYSVVEKILKRIAEEEAPSWNLLAELAEEYKKEAL